VRIVRINISCDRVTQILNAKGPEEKVYDFGAVIRVRTWKSEMTKSIISTASNSLLLFVSFLSAVLTLHQAVASMSYSVQASIFGVL
jgi:hypothetical protein